MFHLRILEKKRKNERLFNSIFHYNNALLNQQTGSGYLFIPTNSTILPQVQNFSENEVEPFHIIILVLGVKIYQIYKNKIYKALLE